MTSVQRSNGRCTEGVNRSGAIHPLAQDRGPVNDPTSGRWPQAALCEPQQADRAQSTGTLPGGLSRLIPDPRLPGREQSRPGAPAARAVPGNFLQATASWKA